MVMRQITLSEFQRLYEDGYVSEIVTLKDRIFGRSIKGQADNPKRHEVVFAILT